MRCLHCGFDGLDSSTVLCPKCKVHLPSLMRDMLPAGTELHGGKYRIDYALGRGGFGITYRAVHLRLEQLAAVKEFYPQEQALRDATNGSLSVKASQRDSYERALRRFVREGRVLARLDHPSVVRVRDLFEERGTAYLVMDLVQGKSLREVLDDAPGRRLPEERVRDIVAQLVGALEEVHREGVYHLDIKPDNVLLTPKGRAVLIDFGAARQNLSTNTTQAFTPEYAAPEVMAGTDVGPESDIFELGMMTHEMLTGKLPTSAMRRWVEDDWTPDALEQPWRTLVHSSLRLRREERPSSVREWWKSAPAEREEVRAPSPQGREPDAPVSSEREPLPPVPPEPKPSNADVMQGGSTPVQQQPAAKVKREGWTKTKVGLVVIAAAAVAVAIGAVVAFFALSPSGSGNTNAVANSSAGAASVNADARGGANANAGTAAAASNVAPAAENRPANVSTNVNSNYANNAAVADDPVLGAALPALNGGTFRLADYAGKVVVLNLWATWCGPCRSETPSLVRMSRDYRKRGVEVIGLSTEDAASSREKVRAFAQEFGIDYRLGFAPRDFALRLMNGDARIPQTFVMRDGRELNRFIGYNEQRPQQLRAAVEQALTAR